MNNTNTSEEDEGNLLYHDLDHVEVAQNTINKKRLKTDGDSDGKDGSFSSVSKRCTTATFLSPESIQAEQIHERTKFEQLERKVEERR